MGEQEVISVNICGTNSCSCPWQHTTLPLSLMYERMRVLKALKLWDQLASGCIEVWALTDELWQIFSWPLIRSIEEVDTVFCWGGAVVKRQCEQDCARLWWIAMSASVSNLECCSVSIKRQTLSLAHSVTSIEIRRLLIAQLSVLIH